MVLPHKWLFSPKNKPQMTENKITFPETALILLIGSSNSGKSTFAKKHFLATEVISSDHCRGLVCDNENSNEATHDAFDLLHYIASKRLARNKLTVVDATNTQTEARRRLVELAREYNVLPVAIVLNLPAKVCEERNKHRTDKILPRRIIQKQCAELRRSLRGLKREGFRFIDKLNSEEEINNASIERTKLWVDKRDITGSFDIIGDVHGCFNEMCELIKTLGYSIEKKADKYSIAHPEKRKLVFVGDLVDRGPKTPEVLHFTMNVCQNNSAFCVAGNHDAKLYRKLSGKNVQLKHGLQQSIDQLNQKSNEFIEDVKQFLDSLISHYVFDKGRLVVAHAGLTEELQGRASSTVRQFAMYGETTGEIDEYGYPVRYEWASDYRGNAYVVYGHTPVTEAEWVNKTINIDTGCVFGGKLTALRYPEMETISIPAKKTYYESVKPLSPVATSKRRHDDLLDIKDVLGKKIINTRLRSNITIREEHSSAVLETMSRFAINPKWLIYLPSTMSPSETSPKEDFLEYPSEAFHYYKRNDVKQVICEEKHMGSRVIVVICKSTQAAQKRFGIVEEDFGTCYTRTGRKFFNDTNLEKKILSRLQTTISKLNWWEAFDTDWFCLDAEIMPWSLKAQALLNSQYAAVGSAAKTSLKNVKDVLDEAQANHLSVEHLIEKFTNLQLNAEKFIQAYQEYCWPIHSINDIKFAPFHLLASEGKVHVDKNHEWHMQTLSQLSKFDPELFLATKNRIIDLNDEQAVLEACNWWEEYVAKGGEGFVIKPLNFIQKSKKGLLQPALKTRGVSYLRIIYGPNYDRPENLTRLKERSLSKKQSLALREFSLGIEALERFIHNEPLYLVHECVFGILALESDPVDPRL